MRVITRWKDHGLRGFQPVLANMLASHIESNLPRGGLELVTIPSRGSTTRKRGFESMTSLAQSVAAHNPDQWRASVNTLTWQRTPVEQRGLSDSERRENLSGAISVRVPPERAVLLVDDVLTSGATLRCAIETLSSAGVIPVGAIVLAAPRKVLSQDLVKSVAKAPHAV